jgi:hypothetical protein
LGAIIKRAEGNNSPEFIVLACDNGFEDLVMFDYFPDTLTWVRPSTEGYRITSYPLMDVNNYLRFPKTDHDIYMNMRNPGYHESSFSVDRIKKKYWFWTYNNPFKTGQVGYEVHYDFKKVDIIIGSAFRVVRDSLVANNYLKEPYTDTEEYKTILKDNIKYWKNGSWVTRMDLD